VSRGDLLGLLRIGGGLVFALAVLGGSANPEVATAADAPLVYVQPVDGGKTTLTARRLQGREDVRDQLYVLGDDEERVTGWSVAKLLQLAKVDKRSFGRIEIRRADGLGTVTLDHEQALTPATADGGPPVVYAAGRNTGFREPGIAPFFEPFGITLRLEEGEAIDVAAKASSREVDTGESVTLKAAVAGASRYSGLRYEWNIGGKRVPGVRVEHEFPKPGTYSVRVEVSSADGGFGSSDPIAIEVGDPKQGSGPGGNRRSRNGDEHGGAGGAGAGTGTGSAGGTGTGSGADAGSRAGVAGSDPSPDRASEPLGNEVEGVLISGISKDEPVDVESAAASGGSAASPGGSASASPAESADQGGLKVPMALTAVLGLVALLCGGAGFEARDPTYRGLT